MQSVIQNTKLNMNVVRFELIELPYPTLARFGLTQEMIEDLPMRVLDEICDGRHSPVLPVCLSNSENLSCNLLFS